jgi:hypothetical protein
MTSPQTIIQIREATDLVRTVSQYVKLRRVGTKQVGLCPFHQERTPSFSVDADKQLWYCFGCGTGGDVFTFLEKVEGDRFPGALKRLSEATGIPLDTNLPAPSRRQIREALELEADATWLFDRLKLYFNKLIARIYYFDRQACAHCRSTENPKGTAWIAFFLARAAEHLEIDVEALEDTSKGRLLNAYLALPAKDRKAIRKLRQSDETNAEEVAWQMIACLAAAQRRDAA